MRIIAGEFRHRVLKTPRDESITRPIPDRVKESLFSLLRGHCEGASVFDAFAGTGAIGLEAVSRGASRCVFVEQNREAARLLQANIDMLGAGDRCQLVIGDALGPGALARVPRPLTLAFFDPPYPLVREQVGFRRVMAQLASVIDLLAPDGFAILRTPWPLLVSTGPEPVPQSPEPRKFKPKSKRERHNWLAELGRDDSAQRRRARQPRLRHPDEDDDFIELSPEEVEVLSVAPQEGEPAKATPPRAEQVRPDLTLPNAREPETHEFHSMALHLYMKRT